MREVQFMVQFGRGRLAFAAICLVSVVAGCQSGDGLGVLNAGRQPEPANRVTAEDLLAYCPPVIIAQDGAVHNSYARGGRAAEGGQDDPTKLIYRASIIDATRSCAFDGGIMNMTVAVAGRVVPGPAASSGTVTVPLRVTLYRDTEEVYSQRHQQDVALNANAGATQFVINDTGISTPRPSARNMRVVIRYEDAPAPRRR